MFARGFVARFPGARVLCERHRRRMIRLPSMEVSMRKLAAALLLLVLGLGVAALQAVSAAWPRGNNNPCANSRGKGTGQTNNQLCKQCPVPDAGCTFFECSVCGCSYQCVSGAAYTVPPLRD
jgi:hypothetical protein